MPQRVVVQPNGKYAYFSTVVDDFIHYDADREGMLAVLCEEYQFHPIGAEDKVKRGEADPGRFERELETIEIVHGAERRKNGELMLTRKDGEPEVEEMPIG